MPPDFAVAYRPVPLLSLAGRRVTAVACGGSHTLAIVSPSAATAAAAPAVYAWGTGTVGQLGLGSGTPVCETPTIVALPPDAGPLVAVFAGGVAMHG